MSNETILQRVRNAAGDINLKQSAESQASKAIKLTRQTLETWRAVNLPQGSGAFGLESLTEVVPLRNTAFEVDRDGDPKVLMKGLTEMGLSPRHVMSVAEQVMTHFDKGATSASDLLRGNQQITGQQANMAWAVGREGASQLSVFEETGGMEAFGDDINRLATDDRLTTALMIMRPADNIMDKALARVVDTSPVVTIRIPSPEAWDWSATQAADSTVYTRSGQNNTYKLRDLYRNPTPVNSEPKKIVPVLANDTKGVIWNNNVAYYKTGKEASVLDLSRNSAMFGSQIDRTDLVADGGVVDAILVTITDPNGGSALTETFRIPTASLALSNFVIVPSSRTSGMRQVIMDAVLPISSTTKQYDGSNSAIAAKFTDAKIQTNVRFSSTLNIKDGRLNGSGTVEMELKRLESGAPISNGTNTTFGNLTATVSAYSVNLRFDEENMRKANLAIWVDYYEQQFVVPRGRVYFTDYALSQDLDDNALSTTSSVMALGNGKRGLNNVVGALNDVSRALKFAADHPEIAQANAIDEQSFASALVKPTVLTTVLDFDVEELNVMNESTRLSEMHGRFRARFLSMASQAFAKSLMINQYKPGDTVVIKAWVHQSIADVVIGILDYHPDLQDRASTSSGADYSMTLPNGYRLDIIKSNMDCLQNRLYAVPVIESDMTSILSAAQIRDCGTVTTNYQPTNNGSATRRVATTSREIVMVSNKVGICMEIRGMQAQLGDIGYNEVALNKDYTDALAA